MNVLSEEWNNIKAVTNELTNQYSVEDTKDRKHRCNSKKAIANHCICRVQKPG